jgi:hypothetical protein
MSTWATVRAALVTALEGVAITSPIAETMKKVHATPPGTLQDFPCFVIYPPAREVVRRPGGWRVTHETVRCDCFINDSDRDRATDLADAYAEAAIDTIDGVLRFGGTDRRIISQRFEEVSPLSYGGVTYVGFTMLLLIELEKSVTYTN